VPPTEVFGPLHSGYQPDLIKNPFDDDFKEFVSQFSGLMRSIVATIDTVGLKRRMLGEHRRAADKLVREIVEGHFSSAIMGGVQETA